MENAIIYYPNLHTLNIMRAAKIGKLYFRSGKSNNNQTTKNGINYSAPMIVQCSVLTLLTVFGVAFLNASRKMQPVRVNYNHLALLIEICSRKLNGIGQSITAALFLNACQ